MPMAPRLAASCVVILSLIVPITTAQPIHGLPSLPELKFAPIPAGSLSRYTGDRFSYMEAGRPEAFPLVLLHGLIVNSMHWRFQFAGLSDRYRVIAWNAPGYMLSDNLVKDTPDCADYADAVNDFVTALRIDRFYLMANSFGTRIAQCYVIHHPGRVVALVMAGTGIAHPAPADARARRIAAAQQSIAKGGYGFGAERLPPIGPNATPEIIRMEQSIQVATNPRGFMQAVRFDALDETYTPDYAGRFTMPVLLIKGSEDRNAPIEQNDAILLKTLAHGRQAVVPGAGHLVEVAAWERVNELLRVFLARRTLP